MKIPTTFGFRISAFGFPSAFGFRISALIPGCPFRRWKLSVGCSTFALVLLVGCAIKPLKPGRASIHSGPGTNGFHSEILQPENPAQSAAQNFERTTETELPLPAGTKVTESSASASASASSSSSPSQSPVMEKTIVLSQPTVQKTRVTEKAGTTIGAAQKDTAREIGAKLASLKGIVWVGVVLFLFGIASLAYPPLRAIIGSVTTSVAIILGGLALMVLPTLIVGNELLILGGVALAVGAWFLAHRHGKLSGQLAAVSSSSSSSSASSSTQDSGPKTQDSPTPSAATPATK